MRASRRALLYLEGTVVRVLVADDDVGARQKMSRILTRAGLEVVLVDDGLEALSAVRQSDFDLVFLDVYMPRLNGLETLRVLHRQYPHVKVCMLTALGRQDLILEVAGYGAIDFISKPVDPQNVLAVIEKWCAPSALQSSGQDRLDVGSG